MVEDDRELREHMTAEERRQKTVERKRLKQLRNEQQRKTKRRKVLKLEEHVSSVCSSANPFGIYLMLTCEMLYKINMCLFRVV